MYSSIEKILYRQEPVVLSGTPVPAHLLCTDLPFLPAPYLELPEPGTDWRKQYPRQKQKKIREAHNRLKRQHKNLAFRTFTRPADLGHWLPQVRQIFLKRWDRNHSSCLWRRDSTFRHFTRAALVLAEQGKVELIVLFIDEVPCTYSFNFLNDNDREYFLYHHSIDPGYSQFSPGRLLDEYIIDSLVQRGFHILDFMQGEGRHKSFWTRTSRMTCRRITSPRTPGGHLIHPFKVRLIQLRILVQRSHRLRPLAKQLLQRVSPP
ncbi:MAG: GNAT family N-acetyltransferase [Thiothrix sp.]|nr:GNAT family N-acetyltransferase [Thiothrix sp.]HPE60381.1 GNAT family N-acetyltransferase [Thiolinea sp.]